eukprot:5686186-Amphidinium_carterae.2
MSGEPSSEVCFLGVSRLVFLHCNSYVCIKAPNAVAACAGGACKITALAQMLLTVLRHCTCEPPLEVNHVWLKPLLAEQKQQCASQMPTSSRIELKPNSYTHNNMFERVVCALFAVNLRVAVDESVHHTPCMLQEMEEAFGPIPLDKA